MFAYFSINLAAEHNFTTP